MFDTGLIRAIKAGYRGPGSCVTRGSFAVELLPLWPFFFGASDYYRLSSKFPPPQLSLLPRHFPRSGEYRTP